MQIFRSAFDEFLQRERANILNDISEPNLCGRLMIYMGNYPDNVGNHRRESMRLRVPLS